MQHLSRSRWVPGALALCAALALTTGAILAQDSADKMAPASGGGVTFVNNSSHEITVFARYGADDASCEHKPNQAELHVTPKSNSSVDSGTTKVCFCLSVPDRDVCPNGWSQVKAGSKRVFQ